MPNAQRTDLTMRARVDTFSSEGKTKNAGSERPDLVGALAIGFITAGVVFLVLLRACGAI